MARLSLGKVAPKQTKANHHASFNISVPFVYSMVGLWRKGKEMAT
jgi:hypothetical protein